MVYCYGSVRNSRITLWKILCVCKGNYTIPLKLISPRLSTLSAGGKAHRSSSQYISIGPGMRREWTNGSETNSWLHVPLCGHTGTMSFKQIWNSLLFNSKRLSIPAVDFISSILYSSPQCGIKENDKGPSGLSEWVCSSGHAVTR